MDNHQDNSCGCKENGLASCNVETCTCESGCGDEKKPANKDLTVPTEKA